MPSIRRFSTLRLSENGPSQETIDRLDQLQHRRDQTRKSIRAVLDVGEHDGGFLSEELNRLNGELKSIDQSIREVQEWGE